MELFEHFNFWALVVPSLITTFIVSAITSLFDTYFSSNTIRKKFLVATAAFIVTVLMTTFTKGTLADYQKIILNTLFTMAFAVLFYSYFGGWIVGWFFDQIKAKIKPDSNNSNGNSNNGSTEGMIL